MPTTVVRYHLLATVRDYAKERLAQAAEEDLARQAHLRYYADFVEQLEPRIGGSEGPDPADLERELNRIEAETPNLRTALEYARSARDVRGALRLVAPLERYAYLRGQYSEVRHWMDAAVTIGPNAPTRLLAKGLLGGGRLALLQCDYAPAVGRLEAALRLYRELEDPRGVARTLQVLGSVAGSRAVMPGRSSCMERAWRSLRSAGDRSAVASAHGYLGFTAWLQGDFELAATRVLDRAGAVPGAQRRGGDRLVAAQPRDRGPLHRRTRPGGRVAQREPVGVGEGRVPRGGRLVAGAAGPAGGARGDRAAARSCCAAAWTCTVTCATGGGSAACSKTWPHWGRTGTRCWPPSCSPRPRCCARRSAR